MSDYFEIDFLDVNSKRSGDAITLRYKLGGNTYIHVVDGGFQKTGESVVEHTNEYYNNPSYIDHVVVTHSDGDHAGGLGAVLEQFDVGILWILRPWEYADELIDRFTRFTNVENLKRRLRDVYPGIDTLESIATERSITMSEPFQGASIGAFIALSPTKEHFLNMVVESDKTPESMKMAEEGSYGNDNVWDHLSKIVSYLKTLWGEEIFSDDETSAENEMSVVQYASLCGQRILLTGDAGRTSLIHAANYVTECDIVSLPGIDRFQVPHHGSRRNVNTKVLDRWLGARFDSRPENTKFTAIISASKEDEDHPRRAVVRACIHRGAKVLSTEGNTLRTHKNAPDRGWSTATPLEYPEDQEE